MDIVIFLCVHVYSDVMCWCIFVVSGYTLCLQISDDIKLQRYLQYPFPYTTISLSEHFNLATILNVDPQVKSQFKMNCRRVLPCCRRSVFRLHAISRDVGLRRPLLHNSSVRYLIRSIPNYYLFTFLIGRFWDRPLGEAKWLMGGGCLSSEELRILRQKCLKKYHLFLGCWLFYLVFEFELNYLTERSVPSRTKEIGNAGKDERNEPEIIQSLVDDIIC